MTEGLISDARRPIREGQERPYAMRIDARGTVSCRVCGGTQWVEVHDQRSSPTAFTPTLRPCQCHPGYERWRQGWPKLEGARFSQPEFVPKVGHAPEPATQTSF